MAQCAAPVARVFKTPTVSSKPTHRAFGMKVGYASSRANNNNDTNKNINTCELLKVNSNAPARNTDNNKNNHHNNNNNNKHNNNNNTRTEDNVGKARCAQVSRALAMGNVIGQQQHHRGQVTTGNTVYL
jgi:hypothetical protein